MTAAGWPLAVTQWTLGEPDHARAFARIARAGFAAVELLGDPDGPTPAELERLLADHGLAASSVCAMWDADRDAAHPYREARARAAAYLRRCLELGGEVGARTLVCVPTYRTAPLAARADELRWAAETIAEAVGALEAGPTLAIEPLNRYETHLVRTVADAEELRSLVGHERVAVMGDVFHMNVEEPGDVAGTLREHAPRLAHVHLADSNRREPGAGHLDIAAIVDALGTGGFAGTTSLEFLPATDPALRAAREHLVPLWRATRRDDGWTTTSRPAA